MHIFGFSLRCVHSITGHRTAPLLMNKCHTSSSAPRKRLMNIQIWEGEWLNLPQWNKRSESCEVCGISTGWLKEITLQNVNNFSYFGMKIIPHTCRQFWDWTTQLHGCKRPLSVGRPLAALGHNSAMLALCAYLNYTLGSTKWRLSTQQTASLSLWPDWELHDNCAPSIGVAHSP